MGLSGYLRAGSYLPPAPPPRVPQGVSLAVLSRPPGAQQSLGVNRPTHQPTRACAPLPPITGPGRPATHPSACAQGPAGSQALPGRWGGGPRAVALPLERLSALFSHLTWRGGHSCCVTGEAVATRMTWPRSQRAKPAWGPGKENVPLPCLPTDAGHLVSGPSPSAVPEVKGA